MTTPIEKIVISCLEKDMDNIDPQIIIKLESARMKAIASLDQKSLVDVLVISPYVSAIAAISLVFGLGSVQAAQKASYDEFLVGYTMEQATCPEDITKISDVEMFSIMSESDTKK